ncbi:MAG: carotenoid 1,2-hydratase [Pseudomonadota bacterium]
MARFDPTLDTPTTAFPTRYPADARPLFDTPVPGNGYCWWYLDGLSDDEDFGITLIVFVGSVFSPYYAWARRREGNANATDFVSVNVALYRRRGRGRWAMTERNAASLERSKDHYRLGSSALEWHNDHLRIRINERCAPFGDELKGDITLQPLCATTEGLILNPKGGHRWQAIAPAARLRVDFKTPGWRWDGTGYLDHNRGDEPLEAGFDYWTWSRQHRKAASGTETFVTYDFWQRGGERGCAAPRFDTHGGLTLDPAIEPASRLANGLWGVARTTRMAGATIAQGFEDTPFYTRSLLDHPDGPAVFECLDLKRFSSRWVQTLLPFRMPRWTRPVTPLPS